ncbi:MAG: hypothetical protein DDT26_02100 [Dehalococcoidia bacterium]|nr:hypothetical protein [Chloroflexota bacterium]
MNTVEDAYQVMADNLLWFVEGENWSLARAKSSVWSKSTQTSLSRRFVNHELNDDKFPPANMVIACHHALLFLRDHILRTTGQRIWGLTFTLYPDGQFKIEYDYNKPEGYEESDEVITGDEINASLANLTNQGKPD